MEKKTSSPPQAILPLAVLLAGVYIGAQMLSDIASLKIGLVAGLAVDMGTFIYPITFTMRDLVHKALGKRAAQTIVLTAAGVNVFMALYLWGAALVPPAPDWPLQGQFQSVLAPVWRIVLASIMAEVVSELIDTEVYSWYVRRTRHHQWGRVLLSNLIAVPVDNLIFCIGAFAWSLPWSAVWQIFLANLVVKFVASSVGTPLIYLIPSRLESDDV